MVSDREPRYRLVDANGNVVGSLFAESDGTLKLQEGTSGSDNEVSVATDGTFTAPSVSTDETVTNTVEYDYSESYPNYPRQPEISSSVSIGPHPSVSNPVLTASDVDDVSNPTDVADPFVVTENGTYHMFVEVIHDGGEDIGHATSQDGLDWTYQGLVLSNNNHIAYPYVFKWDGEWYMSPDGGVSSNEFNIYRADNFPSSWVLEATPLSDGGKTDPTPFRYNGHWYSLFFTGTSVTLYESNSLLSGWSEHPSSPVASNNTAKERPGGRPIVRDNAIDVPWMDNSQSYGDKLRCYRITDLTPSTYSDTEVSTSPLLSRTRDGGWRDDGMHHLDYLISDGRASQLSIVDGRDPSGSWSIGVYSAATPQRAGAKATLDSSTSISSGGFQPLPWDRLKYDYTGDFDLSSGNYTVPETGLYELSAEVQLRPSSSSNAEWRLALRIFNETTSDEIATAHNPTTFDTIMSVGAHTVAQLSAGDTITTEAFQTSGVSQDVFNGANTTWFQIRRVK